jgi:hypothetical protein
VLLFSEGVHARLPDCSPGVAAQSLGPARPTQEVVTPAPKGAPRSVPLAIPSAGRLAVARGSRSGRAAR